ncbi:MAG TPA: AAA family ATPase, partial [Povalibacter sp.]
MPEPRPTERADRRQLTVLFCDVAGSSQLLENLNDEEWSYVLREYHASCQSIISSFDGHIAQFLGDGFLAYFGYPVAHENNSHRAIKAGLEVLAQLETMNERIRAAIAPREARLSLRIAVHTGAVVVDEVGRNTSSIDHIALGIVPTIAARLQQEARENTLVISEATHRLVRGAFQCKDLGKFSLKGISAPQGAYEVTGESGLQSRFDIEIAKGLTPFVGREQELATLVSVWEQVRAGAGRVVLIEGEAGIGKSRLAHEFTRALDSSSCQVFVGRCSSYNSNSAYLPVIQLIHALLELRPEDDDATRLSGIEQSLVRTGREAAEVVPLVARLLSIPCRDRYPEQPMAGPQDKQRLQELLTQWLCNQATACPLVLVVEDLHWVDPSSKELLDRLVASIGGQRILVVAAFRPEYQPKWQGPHVHTLSIGPLTRRHAEVMVRHLQGTQPLTADVVQRLVANTDGVPLFLEELTLSLMRDGSTGAVPASLHDLLMARLDQLGPAKELAQLAATIGQEFSHEVLASLAELEAPTFDEHIDKLVGSGLVWRNDTTTSPTYAFKHALVRDTAYHSLMSRARRSIHARLADVFSERFADVARIQPELVAHHCTEAGLAQRAVDLWQKAGLRSAERCELPEAIRHLRKGLEVLG